MKYFALGLLIFSSIAFAPQLYLSSARAMVSVSPTDPDFSIVLFPDTQYYFGQNAYVFQDQANWVVANKAAKNRINIQLLSH
jgi:hypothetical protein